MYNDLIKGPFKSAYKKISKLKGEKKERAYEDLVERMEIYSVALDFADFYPRIYTPEVFAAIVNAKNNIEACNIMTSLRKRQGEYA